MDEKISSDLLDAIGAVEKVGVLLNGLYYYPGFSNFSNRPVISMLIDATKYLSSNLRILEDKYRRGAGR